MAKKKADHLHIYKKKVLGTNGFKVFKCMKPGCTHYVRVDLAENALCACNRCGEAMVLTKAAMQLVKPHCPDCTKSTKTKKLENLDDFLEGRI